MADHLFSLICTIHWDSLWYLKAVALGLRGALLCLAVRISVVSMRLLYTVIGT